MAGRTLLVVGVGHTGGALASRARALGMRVVGVRASGAPHPEVEAMHGPAALPGLWGQADVVSLNLRLTPATAGLVDAQAFEAMRPGTLLLNGARGGVVDQPALIAALEAGHIGGAWLDVTDPEPLPVDSPLWAMDNVILTPHAADQVADFPQRFAQRFLDNLARYRAGEPLVGVVARP
jgi:phosphoglycerate dehydrogenase-like enzyme